MRLGRRQRRQGSWLRKAGGAGLAPFRRHRSPWSSASWPMGPEWLSWPGFPKHRLVVRASSYDPWTGTSCPAAGWREDRKQRGLGRWSLWEGPCKSSVKYVSFYWLHETIIMIDTYLRAEHSRSISSKVSGDALESSQAEQSGGSKGNLRLLHCGGVKSWCVQWINGLEVEVIPLWESTTFIYRSAGGQCPPVPGETLPAEARTNYCDPGFVKHIVDLQ